MAREMGSFGALADAAAGEHTDHIVLVEPVSGRSITYDQLVSRSRSLAAHLAGLGARPGDPIALTVTEPAALAELLVGVVYAGFCAVPINMTWTVEKRADAIARAGATIVLSEPPPLDDAPAAGPPAPPGTEALLMFTSGSTGAPKGVVMTQANLVACAQNTAASHQLGPGDAFMCVLPLWHMNSVDKLLGTIATGGRVVLPPRFAVGEFWRWVDDHRCTWMALVPTIVAQLVQRTRSNDRPAATTLERIRYARCSSAPLAPTLRDEFEALFGVPLLEGMGMTEAGSVFLNPPGCARSGSVGTAVGIDARLVDGDGVPVATGDVGTLQVRGPSVMGRYDDADATAAAFTPDGWFTTGDLARCDDDGYFFVVGRSDEIVIKAGVNIAPREVDDVLATHPEVAEAATVGVDDEMLGQDLEAYVVARTAGVDPARLRADLLDLCAERLGVMKTPRAVHIVDDLPRGPSGKVQPMRLAPGGDGRAAASPPAGDADVEATLVRMWRDLLECDDLGAHDDFFDVGGYSILALEAAYRTRRAFGIQFSLATFFEHPTIAAQVGHIAAAMGAGAAAGHQPAVSSVLLNPEAAGSVATPLFCAYGPFQYRALARRLGTDRAVYGIFADTESEIVRGEATSAPPTVEELAAMYVGSARVVQPSGPYLLAGYSFGGRIALEMAQQLRHAGEEVARLFVLDTYLRAERPSRIHAAASLARRAVRVGPTGLARRLLGGPATDDRRTITARADRAQADFREGARERYRPQPYPGDTVLVRATEPAAGDLGRRQDALLGWGDVATGSLVVHDVAGDHLSIVREPAVATVARHLQRHLDAVP